MHHVDQCSNCGINVSRELGIVTPTTVQHRNVPPLQVVAARTASRPPSPATKRSAIVPQRSRCTRR